MITKLTSLKPFLFTAYYEWLLENQITPHILVNAKYPGVKVPQDSVIQGTIMLSLKPSAICDFKCLKKGISFKARFKGVSFDVYVPYLAMEELIAIETGASFPIGRALAQLELAEDDDEITPDEGTISEQPEFELQEESEPLEASQSKEPEDKDKSSIDGDSSSPVNFEFVKD